MFDDSIKGMRFTLLAYDGKCTIRTLAVGALVFVPPITAFDADITALSEALKLFFHISPL